MSIDLTLFSRYIPLTVTLKQTSRDMDRVKCPVCLIPQRSIQRLLTHLSSIHDGDMGLITCNIDNCQRTFAAVSSWKSHLYRTVSHRRTLGLPQPYAAALPFQQGNPENGQNLGGENLTNSDDGCGEMEADAETISPDPKELYEQFHSQFHRSFLNFAIKIREKDLLPQSVTNSIIDDVQGLLELSQFTTSDIVRKQLQIDPTIQGLEYLLGDETFFQSVSQSVKGNKISASGFPHVQPLEIRLGEAASRKHVMHIIPLKNLLTILLSNHDIVARIRSNLEMTRDNACDEKLFDVKYTVSHAGSPIDIPLMFYIDEFEPCNPLGSRRKVHKLSGIYFTIASIPAHLRSKLKSLFLYGLVYHKYVKAYGYGAIFRNLIQELQDLYDNPLQVTLKNGDSLSFNVRLLLVTADNLSAHDILGLQTHFNCGKVSRYCLTDHSEMRIKFDSVTCPTRSHEQYKRQIVELGNFPEQVKLDYGIKARCVFDEIPYIDVTKLVPPDVMHDFLEGVAPTVICVSLLNIIQNSALTLGALNDRLASFKYGSADIKNKYGSTLTNVQLNKFTIPGTASEKYCLLRLLPLVLHDIMATTPAPKGIKLLLKCLDISEIIMAFVINREWVSHLHALIIEHHKLVKELAPVALRPKFHFLTHYPQLIFIYGPPRHYYTMRFESMHQYFKRLTERTKNFINLTHTLSNRFQNLLSYYLYQKDFYESAPIVLSGETKTIHTISERLAEVIRGEFGDIRDDECVYISSQVNISDVCYKKGTFLVWKLSGGYDEIPQFMLVKGLIQIRSKWFIHGQLYFTSGYDKLLHAYVVSDEQSTTILAVPGDEIDHSSLSLYPVEQRKVIPLKYKITANIVSSHL